ncbi:MAG: PKD domain-containing protein [Chitinophagaceae bacterium]|nr:PKD domain-containing protein [Chitinophagaceae bacterium]
MNRKLILVSVLLFIAISSFAQTANWSAVLPAAFPTNVSGQIHGISRVSQMKFHPSNANKIYAVSARGGLFISTNAGLTWSVAPGTDFMPYARLASICIDHTNDQILYLGTGDHNYYYSGNGVMKSTNGGLTFTQTGLNNTLVVDMIMHPVNNNIIVAVTNAGIYKTTNAGDTWTLKSAARPFDDIKQKTPVSQVLYASTTDSAFFRSNDFGETWTQITSGIVLPAGITNGDGCRIAVTPADSNVVYLGMVANGGMIYKSTNGGTSFTAMKTAASPYLTYYSNVSTSSGQGDYNFGLGVDRVNANIVYFVAHNNWKSTNGGTTWSQLTNWWEKCHTDMHQILTSPYNNNNLYNANDGGIFLSTDGGNNWTPKSDGIYGYEIYHGNCSPTRKDMISIGTQDNGELYSTTTGWFTNRGGDWGSQCAFDYRSNSSMVYYYENNKRRLVNGSDATYGLPAQVTYLQDIAFHRSNANLGFVADSFIYRTTNLTNAVPTWTQIASTGKIVKAMHVSYADPNRLYVITNDGVLRVSTNAQAATPTFTTYTLPNSTNISASINTIKSTPGVVYAALNTKVYRSADYGATWTDVTFNLPPVNHVRLIADEFYAGANNELVMIASANTVYYKTRYASQWTIYTDNLPTRTNAVDFSIFNDSTSNTILRYSSYGRGMWETPIDTLRKLKADFAVSNNNPCVGNAVTFSDLSTGNVVSRTWSFPGGTPSSSTATNPVVTYAANGIYNVTLTVSDGTNSKTLTQNNFINTNGSTTLVNEGFEGAINPPTGWQNIDNGTGGVAWAKTNLAGGYGNSANSMMFDNYSWNVPGETDDLITYRFSLNGYSSAKLYFDVAYQVFTGYSDTLKAFVSNDCGTTYAQSYVKGGTVLSTAGSGGNNFVPTAAQWRTDSVVLNAYLGQNVLVKFQNRNGYGNKLYLDNIMVKGAPTSSFTGSPLNPCAGTSVTFTNTTTGAPVSYSWTFPGGTPSTSTATNPVVTYNIPGTYAVTLVSTNAGGSHTTTQNGYITVSNSVVPAISISTATTTICSGASTTFTATAVNGGSTPSYQWKVNGVNAGTNSPTFTTSALTNGQVVTCTLTSNATCAVPTTANSNSLTMTVNTTLVPSISISTATTTICSGASTTFTASAVNGGSTPSYQWKVNGVNAGTNSPTFTTSALTNGQVVTCTLTSNATCAVPATANSNSLTMTVNTTLVPSISISTATTTICSGASSTFTASAVNGGSIPSYQWKVNGVNAGTNSPTFTTSALTNGQVVTCTLTSNAACASPATANSNSLTMTVNATLVPSISISTATTTICSGASTTFTASAVNGGSIPSYQWKVNGVNAGTNSPTFTTSALTNGQVVTCTLTSNAACASPATANSNSLTMTVNTILVPSISISTATTTICSGASSTFTASAVNGGSIPSYQWKVNGVNAGTNSPTFITSSLTNGQVVTCILTSNAACAVPATANSNSLTMTVNPCGSNMTLNLTCFIQGYYMGGGIMQKVLFNENVITNPLANLVDTLTVELHSATSPYAMQYSFKGVLQTNGTLACTFPAAAVGSTYYITVKHRNTVETWSALPVLMATTVSYDFSNVQTKAYGNNMIQMSSSPTVWAFYSGDIDQSGGIDGDDFVLLSADMQAGNGGYVGTDIDGSGGVDGDDFNIFDPNSSIGVGAFMP